MLLALVECGEHAPLSVAAQRARRATAARNARVVGQKQTRNTPLIHCTSKALPASRAV